jgi:hypothetical protein
MTIEVSYFSLASIAALVLFLGVMIPRSLFHLLAVAFGGVSGKRMMADRWLIAIAVAFLLCGAMGLATGVFHATAQGLFDTYEGVALSFLFFAAPAVLQVLRAWKNTHAKKVKALSHALVALAVLSLPASMAIPTAALLQLTAAPAGQPGAAPADNPAAAVADVRYFTDNNVANDPVDYPIAVWLQDNFSWKHTYAPDPTMMGKNFYREIPTYTGFWFDQTTEALTFEGTTTFGAEVSRITQVPANYAFALAVFLYKLLCGLVLVAVSWDTLIKPALDAAAHRRRAA